MLLHRDLFGFFQPLIKLGHVCIGRVTGRNRSIECLFGALRTIFDDGEEVVPGAAGRRDSSMESIKCCQS